MLEKLWIEIDQLNQQYLPENSLKTIYGRGKVIEPNVMFVFINPTIRNISTNPQWQGIRAPFIGTKHIWNILHKGGFFDEDLLATINKSKTWSAEFAEEVYKHIESRGLYITNLVKWTGSNGDLPDTNKIKLFLPLFIKEIEIVEPKYILTFGLIPFKAITGKSLKLSDYYSKTFKSQELETYGVNGLDTTTKVVPCYFPVGRGDPKKAVDILRILYKLL